MVSFICLIIALVIPTFVDNFSSGLSREFAALEKAWTPEYLNESFKNFSKSKSRRKMGVLACVSPWLLNLDCFEFQVVQPILETLINTAMDPKNVLIFLLMFRLNAFLSLIT